MLVEVIRLLEIITHWDKFSATLQPGEDRIVYIGLLCIAHSLVFFTVNTVNLLFWIPRWAWLEKFRFQPRRRPDSGLIANCIAYVTLFHLLSLLMAWAAYPYAVAWNPKLVFGDAPSWKTVLLHFAVSYFLTDLTFYWGHRLLHTKWLYRNVHKQHHQFYVTIGFASEYAHPVELLLSNIVPAIIGPVLLRSHLLVFAGWITLVILGTSWGHSGMAFPFSLSTNFHDFHHSHPHSGNFGSLRFWDWLMGTSKAYNGTKPVEIPRPIAQRRAVAPEQK